jgi:hypothetical protein
MQRKALKLIYKTRLIFVLDIYIHRQRAEHLFYFIYLFVCFFCLILYYVFLKDNIYPNKRKQVEIFNDFKLTQTDIFKSSQRLTNNYNNNGNDSKIGNKLIV